MGYGVMVAQRTLNPQPSEGVSVGSNPTTPTMKIIYKKLEDNPFEGIIETWNYYSDILCYNVHPSVYGKYWEEYILEDATINDLLSLIEKCVWITKVLKK